MLEHVLERHASFRVDHEDPRYEVFSLRTHSLAVNWVLHQIQACDVAISVVVGGTSEGS